LSFIKNVIGRRLTSYYGISLRGNPITRKSKNQNVVV